LSTKIHLAVRGLGCRVRFILTPGQAGDAPQAAALVDGLPAAAVLADARYDADSFRQIIAEKQAQAVIPNNPSRTKKHPLDTTLYAERHLVAC
jgi:transposase